MIDHFGIPLLEDLSQWDSDTWLHYSEFPSLQINPKGSHLDPAGIYLFPENFKTAGMWAAYPYKFVVRLKQGLKILDLAHLSVDAAIEILKAMLPADWHEGAIARIKEASKPIDQWWEELKNYFILSSEGRKAGAWNKAFRDLGYDALFDDTESIHAWEVQLLILDPRNIKVVERIDQKSSGFEETKSILGRIADLAGLIGKVTVKEPKRERLWGDTHLEGSVRLERGDRYAEWTVSPRFDARFKGKPTEISVSLRSSPDIQSHMSRGASIRLGDNLDKLDTKIQSAIRDIFGEEAMYVESLDAFGIPLSEKMVLKTWDLFAKQVSEAYQARPSMESQYLASWKSLIAHVEKMYAQMQSRISVEFVDQDPYPSEKEVIADIEKNKRLKVFTGSAEHPVWTVEQNLKFRAYHDYLSHVAGGHTFGIKGEIAAYNQHAKMAPRDALIAMFTEIIGQAMTSTQTGSFPEQKICKLWGFDYINLGKIDEQEYQKNFE